MIRGYCFGMCVSFHSFSGCTLFVIFLLLRFSITTCTLSSQKDLIFAIPSFSDRFLINTRPSFSNTAVNGTLLSLLYYVFALPASLICRCYLVCLIHLISCIIYKLRVCLLGFLVCAFMYKVNWQSRLPPKRRKI